MRRRRKLSFNFLNLAQVYRSVNNTGSPSTHFEPKNFHTFKSHLLFCFYCFLFPRDSVRSSWLESAILKPSWIKKRERTPNKSRNKLYSASWMSGIKVNYMRNLFQWLYASDDNENRVKLHRSWLCRLDNIWNDSFHCSTFRQTRKILSFELLFCSSNLLNILGLVDCIL